MAKQLEEMSGKYVKQVYFKAENNFVIGRLDDNTAVKGNTTGGALIEGLTYTFYGKWHDDPEYGRQFLFNSAIQKTPLDYHGVAKWLQMHCSGIGPVTARQLCDIFGPEHAIATLKNKPEVAAGALQGLRPEVAFEAAKALKAAEATERVDIELLTILQGRGFSAKLRELAIKAWGVEAPKVIRRNPFILLVRRFPSAGWARCDQLYLDLGHNPNALKRQMLCLFYGIRSGMDGSTWHSYAKLNDYLAQNINGPVDCDRAIELGCRSGWLAEHVQVVGKGRERVRTRWIAEGREFRAESRIAEWMEAAAEESKMAEMFADI